MTKEILSDFKVSFIGIGAVRCGTSWMSNILKQHPEVCFSSRKEVMFFNESYLGIKPNQNFDHGLDFYRKFWPQEIKSNMKLGEFSPQYLFDEEAPKRIHTIFPDVKLLLMLRNPVDRAFSHFLYEQIFKEEVSKELNFEEAIEKNNYYKELGYYFKQIKKYLEYFDKDQIKVFIYEDLDNGLDKIIKKLYTSVEVNPGFYPNNTKAFNESREVKYRWMNSIFKIPGQIKEARILKALISENARSQIKKSKAYQKTINIKNYLSYLNSNTIKKPAIESKTKEHLQALYRDDVQELQEYLNRDLSFWLN